MLKHTRDIVEKNGKTVRENNMEIKHNIPIGTLVEVKYDRWHGNGACSKIHARLFVASHDRDCDGTPLYSLTEAKPPYEGTGPNDKKDFIDLTIIDRILIGVQTGFNEKALTIIEVNEEVIRGYGALSWTCIHGEETGKCKECEGLKRLKEKGEIP